MKTLMENWNRFVNEEEEIAVNEADSGRKAGITTPYQILKLTKDNFKFQKRPTDAQQRLKVLQDMDNPNTATVFDLEGDVVGILDLQSDPYWLRSVVTHDPELVDYTLKNRR
jgi:hypothetical protein